MKLHLVRMALVLGGLAGIAGCGGDGLDRGLRNPDPGDNDVDVVVAFGDSITQGNMCTCSNYPARLAEKIDKTVHNAGVPGSKATNNIERVQTEISQFQPGFMLILYGINDINDEGELTTIVAALTRMVQTCKTNQVVPVLATYPDTILEYKGYSPGVLSLNAAIRGLAATQEISCVDLELEFAGDPLLYNSDGLHPNDAGTEVIATAFADLF